ncbi:hypothetical protein Z043-119219 [Arapaima gigas]
MSLRNGSDPASLGGSWILQYTNDTQGLIVERDQGTVYLVFMVGLFSLFTFGIMLSYIRSRKAEGSSDPYHQYIVRDWRRPLVLSSLTRPNRETLQEPIVLGNLAVLQELPDDLRPRSASSHQGANMLYE